MDFLNAFVPNATIAVMCIVIGMVLKWTWDGNARNVAAIPWVLAVCGAALGIAAFFMLPDFAADAFTGVAMGAVSGLAAGGAYQVGHQQAKLRNLDLTQSYDDIDIDPGIDNLDTGTEGSYDGPGDRK